MMNEIVESGRDFDLFLADENATLEFASVVAATLNLPCAIALHGELGAGKTTFVRGLLRTLGVSGAIKSPTYALVESYDTRIGTVHHLDAYRIESDEDFEARGGPDYFDEHSIQLAEWPEKIEGLVRFDRRIRFVFEGEGRRVFVTYEPIP
jgi:tRNA threonylcarbamoyladenosine biosynthesis protein TsaE